MSKLLLISLALLTIGCGQAPTGAQTPASPGSGVEEQPVAPAPLRTFTVTVTGDNVTFTLSLFTDLNEPTEEQLTTGPTTIAPGQTLTYTVTGYHLENSGISRVSGLEVGSGGQWLVATVHVNGVAAEVKNLSDNGNSATFTEF